MDDWKKMFEKQERDTLGKHIPENEKFSDDKELSRDVDEKQTQKLLRKKLNKLKHKALYIDAEYEDTCDIFSHAQNEFISSMFSFCSGRKINPPFGDKKKDDKKEKQETSEELKDLYREIVKATHPDKTKNLSEDEIEERKELYLEAVRGKQEGDYWGIFKAALELNVPIKKLSFAYLEELEKTVADLEQKIEKMKKDLMYQWYYSDQPTQQRIFEQLTKDQEKYE